MIDTEVGEAHIRSIIFIGELKVSERLVPLVIAEEYCGVEDGKTISKVAAFEPQEVQGIEFTLEMHKLEDTGETHVVLRKTPDGAQHKK